MKPMPTCPCGAFDHKPEDCPWVPKKKFMVGEVKTCNAGEWPSLPPVFMGKKEFPNGRIEYHFQYNPGITAVDLALLGRPTGMKSSPPAQPTFDLEQP